MCCATSVTCSAMPLHRPPCRGLWPRSTRQTLDRIDTTRAAVRTRVWDLIAARHGAIPPALVPNGDLGTQIVPRIDAHCIDVYSRQEHAGRLRGRYGLHPMAVPGSPGESHPQAPTDPCVNLSIYTARAVQLSGRVPQLPVREQARGPFPDPPQTCPRFRLAAFQPLVLPHRPTHEMAIYALADRDHRARVEHGEVVQLSFPSYRGDKP